MKKPDDYSTYFNSDGTHKNVPYDIFDLRCHVWIKRQIEIEYLLMSDEEKAHRLVMMKDLSEKWKYHPGGTIFHAV